MTIDRRGFLKAGAAGIAIASAGCSPAHPGARGVAPGTSRFRHGVASGDPLEDRVILWTRVSPTVRAGEGTSITPIRTEWWIARDPAGRDIVARGYLDARPERDFTVKVDAAGLAAGTDYYYAFEVEADGNGVDRSPIGRTRTLPGAEVEHVRLAMAACANYPEGHFNGYANIATRDDLDAVLHLGDYLYEYPNGEYGDGTALGRVPEPPHEIIRLEDYRKRHATYKSDPDLQAAHGRHPWITVWDDHELANNASFSGAENHSPETEGHWHSRRLAAIRAYYEWMPIRELPTGLFRSFRFGRLLDLIMLDTRTHGRDEAIDADFDQANREDRTMLGEDQTRWLLDALSESDRDGSVWRVIGQQVVFSPIEFGPIAFNPDAWDGFRANRRRVLGHLESEGIENTVFLTGDVHSSWVFDVPTKGELGGDYDPETGAGTIAVEFVTPAISSPPIGKSPGVREAFGNTDARAPHLRYLDIDHNGYAILDLRPDRVRAEYIYSDSVETRSPVGRCGAAFESRAGAPHVVRVDEARCDI